jgi:hypothetical protein
MHISYKISKGYYLTKAGKIIQVVIYWHGTVNSGKNAGKHMAKIGLWGRSQDEAFWVDAGRVSFEREPLEKLQKKLQEQA